MDSDETVNNLKAAALRLFSANSDTIVDDRDASPTFHIFVENTVGIAMQV